MRSLEEIQEELDAVRSAMLAIAGGAQSYTIGSRSVTKADLAQLRAWRADLEAELGDADGGAVRVAGCLGR